MNIKKTYMSYIKFLLFPIGILLIMSLLGSGKNPYRSIQTFSTILNQVASNAIVATGMTFVILVGCIDLSVGSIMACCSITLAVAITNFGMATPIAIVITIALGIVLGMINGLVIVKWRASPFIVTLGTMEIYRGMSYLFSGSRTIYLGSVLSVLNTIVLNSVSLAFIITLMMIILFEYILRSTVFGRYVVGIGTNEEAMYLSGVFTGKIKVATFALSGMLVAIAAIFESARMEAVDPNTGGSLELYVIAAVAVGGTSLRGGEGNVWSSFLGTIIMVALETGLSQLGASEPVKRVLTGLVIVIVVIIDSIRNPNNTTRFQYKIHVRR